MDVQRANLPPAIAAGSFESPPTAPTVNSQSHGTKKHQGEPGFITGLWRGWERRNTSSSCPEVKKNHPRGGPAMVCPVGHPSVFLSMERSSQHVWCDRNHHQGKQELGSPFLHLLPSMLAMKDNSALEKEFLKGTLKQEQSWLLVSTLLHTYTGLQQLESFS